MCTHFSDANTHTVCPVVAEADGTYYDGDQSVVLSNGMVENDSFRAVCNSRTHYTDDLPRRHWRVYKRRESVEATILFD